MLSVKDVSDHYKVTVTTGGKEIATGWTPASIRFGVQSRWSTPLESIVSDPLVFAAASVFDTSPYFDWMALAVWMGSEPIQMTIPLEFVAETDAQAEVIEPIKNLLKLALPTKDKGFLIPPGPRPLGEIKVPASIPGSESISKALKSMFNSTSGEIIRINIGNVISFGRIVVLATDVELSNIVDPDGVPMFGTVNLTFRTFDAMDKAEINDILTNRKSPVRQKS